MAKLPHLLHLEIDGTGWITWSLECPYSATEVDDQPGRPCQMVQETMQPYPVRPSGPDVTYILVDDKTVLVYKDTKRPVTGEALETWNEYHLACDEHEIWTPIPGCFAEQYMIESGEWEGVLCLNMTDPELPIKVDVTVLGSNEDAYVDKVVPWTTNP